MLHDCREVLLTRGLVTREQPHKFIVNQFVSL